MAKAAKILHVLWSPQQGPTVGYWDPTIAWAHARTMLGVDVSQVEVLDQLPAVAREDIGSDYDGDDDTPRVVALPVEPEVSVKIAVNIAVEDIDEK